MSAPAPSIDLATVRARLAELAERGGVIAGAALEHLERQAARVLELEARVESLLSREVTRAEELGEGLLFAWDVTRQVAQELADESVERYLAGDLVGCERLAERARLLSSEVVSALDPSGVK